jgi:hypothetical protein
MSALGRAARGTLASIGALTVASGAGLFWDYKYHYGRVNRSLRTVRAGFQTWADFEWHWDEEKFEEIHERIAKRWYDVCCENAGLYVKLGQTVSLMGHVLPPVYTQTFTTLQDQAPIVSYEEIEKVFYKVRVCCVGTRVCECVCLSYPYTCTLSRALCIARTSARPRKKCMQSSMRLRSLRLASHR